MAEICLVIASGTGGFEPGDVAFCKDDDAKWGSAILNNPKFRLIRIPGMTGKEATELFCASQPGDIRENPNLKKRAVTISSVLIPARGKSRGFEIVPRAELVSARLVKTIPSNIGVR